MVASIPMGVYTIKERAVIIKHNIETYKKTRKKQKTEMLNDLSRALHMNRHYIAFLP